MNCVNKYRVAVPLTPGNSNFNTTPRWCYEMYDCTVCKWNVVAVNCGGTKDEVACSDYAYDKED